MPKIEYNGIEFDSEEERLFYLYLEELKDNGYVNDFTFHTDAFVLSEPVKYSWGKKMKTKLKFVESTLLQGHVYTPDFKIRWKSKALEVFYYDIHSEEKLLDKVPFVNNVGSDGNDIGTFVEIKPSFDMNNMQRLFSINQKWVYQEHNVYVQKVIPIGPKNTCLFAKTFVPQKAMLTAKTKKPKKYKFETKSLNEFLGGFNE
jgi:hypothetical protein